MTAARRHGLSYTTFKVTPKASNLDLNTTFRGHLPVEFIVANVGGRAGAHAVLCFARSDHEQAPRYKLVGFAKSFVLQPGASAELTVSISSTVLSLVDADGSRWLRPGLYNVTTAIATPSALSLHVAGAAAQISPALPVQPPKPHFAPLPTPPSPSPRPGPGPAPGPAPGPPIPPIGPTPGCRTTIDTLVYQPSDKKIVGVKTAADCCRLCLDKPDCRAYSWEEYNSLTNAKCWLTSGTPAQPRPCDNTKGVPCSSGVPARY